ncbi:MAG: hypothetical protein IT287_09085 [Bdellovibrionaceae bacterium]|nr:hypothetical protein [Pseudobdellovibrionaceae bacterium]
MKKWMLLTAIIIISQSALARSVSKPSESVDAPSCSDDFLAISKALNACPKEVRQISEAYKFGAIRYIKSDKTKTPNGIVSKDAGDRVVIALKDSKDRFAGSLAVEFGSQAADGGAQGFNCKFHKVSLPKESVRCTLEAVVCAEDQIKESYKNSDGCTKDRCVPKTGSVVIEQ